MKYRTLGKTGLKVSPLCLGTMQFGWTADEKRSFEIMDAYAEAGGNFLDTADIYSNWFRGNPGGVSETIIGRWMKARGNRLQTIVATKARGRMWAGPNGEGLSRSHLLRAAEDSLRRLDTDYIDLYQTHWPDDDTPLEETLRALDDLVTQGKVRYIGCSNEPAWHLCKALWISDKYRLSHFVSTQPHYSLVNRGEYENELEDLCLDQGIAVIPYSPLEGGFLTGKYRRGQTPKSVRAQGLRKYFTKKNFKLIDLLEERGKAHSATVTQMVLAWLLHRPSITAPIIGANSLDQLEDIFGCLDVKLTPEDFTSIDEASR